MAWTIESAGEAETQGLGALLAEVLQARAVSELIIDLRGELGAGKTVFVRGLGRALGVPPAVPIVSPTFTIARAYGLPGPTLQELHHLDAYRLGSVDDLEAAGWEEMCGNGRLTCVEGGGNVEEALPEDRLHVMLTHATLAGTDAEPRDDARRIEIRGGGPVTEGIVEQMQTARESAT